MFFVSLKRVSCEVNRPLVDLMGCKHLHNVVLYVIKYVGIVQACLNDCFKAAAYSI